MQDLIDKNGNIQQMLLLVQGCKRNDSASQRLLYQHFYRYAMSICARYCKNLDEAKEVLNDAFMKVFQKINQYRDNTSFQAWLRRIIINTAIDHYRKELKHDHEPIDRLNNKKINGDSAVNDLSFEELIGLVQRLTPAYRAVFNLYVIDGFNHQEISKILGISEGTSKSNLMKARENLRSWILKMDKIAYAKSV